MRSSEQLELDFTYHRSRPALSGRRSLPIQGDRAPWLKTDVDLAIVGQAHRLPSIDELASEALTLQNKARDLLRIHGAARIADEVRVEWNARLKTCAGRADYRHKLISLNPRLRDLNDRFVQPKVHPVKLDGLKPSSLTNAAESKQSERCAVVYDEIERTFLHELAHLLAQFREKRRKRVAPHGPEWRQACRDLGIADEKRCHDLPFAKEQRTRRLLYKCPNCLQEFPRVRRIRRALACLACCRAHNRGKFDARFRLRLASVTQWQRSYGRLIN